MRDNRRRAGGTGPGLPRRPPPAGLPSDMAGNCVTGMAPRVREFTSGLVTFDLLELTVGATGTCRVIGGGGDGRPER